MEYKLIPLDKAHVYELEALEKMCFSDPWSAGSFLEEIHNPNAVFYVCTYGDKIIGYAGFLYVLDEGYIANVAVHPDFRRKGVGETLINGLLNKASDLGCSFLTLEVRSSNTAAISLYQKYGFIPCGIRRGFYDKPTEDAILMKYTFKEPID
ncbi:MAG: ribosomal protein S18-alanine N-acetyltransferase [Clostridiales bacterium]|nr:ribosomal protein S18-alanine N-acetyltransferase [Clostridiales bacterium]